MSSTDDKKWRLVPHVIEHLRKNPRDADAWEVRELCERVQSFTPSAERCGKLNNGIPCTMPAGTRCPDCAPARIPSATPSRDDVLKEAADMVWPEGRAIESGFDQGRAAARADILALRRAESTMRKP